MKNYKIMPKRRRRDRTIHGRANGNPLSSRKAVELSCLFEEIELRRVLYKLSRPQNVSYSSICAKVCRRMYSSSARFTVSEYVRLPETVLAASSFFSSNTRFVRFMCIV